jgi:prepilin-type N-terminal cleavage/methylation domain-containing protein
MAEYSYEIMRSLRHSSKGFTLLECLLSIVLLSVGVLALCAIQAAYIKSTLQSQSVFEANSLADQVCELILRSPNQVQAFSTSGCGAASGLMGEICRAVKSMPTKRMSDAIVDLTVADAQNNIWTITVTWSSAGASNNVTKRIGL